MGRGDVGGDREAEAAAGRGAPADEALEHVREQLGRDARAVVADRKLGSRGSLRDAQLDARTRSHEAHLR